MQGSVESLGIADVFTTRSTIISHHPPPSTPFVLDIFRFHTSIMDPPGLGIYRRQTLTNCAAEFVETGAGMDTVAQIIDSDDMDELQAISEFAPELDQFVPKGVIVE